MTVLSDPTLLDRFIYAITLYWTDLFIRSHSTGQIYLSDPTLLDRCIYPIPLYWTVLFIRSHSTGQIYLSDPTLLDRFIYPIPLYWTDLFIYIFATQCRRPFIFQTMNSVGPNNLSLKYQSFSPSG